MFHKYLCIIICVFLSSSAFGQRPGVGVDPEQERGETVIDSTKSENTGFLGLEIPTLEDSLELDFVYISDLTKQYPFRDSTLQYFEDYDPIKAFDKFYLTLGNQASSHQSALVEFDSNLFTQLRRNQHSAYNIPLEELKFYNLNRTYNDVLFSPMGSQENFIVKAKFSQEFKEAVNVSVDYLRITHEGTYTSQFARTTNFGVGFWIRNPKKKHQMLVSYASNNHTENMNGGIQSGIARPDTLLGGDINVPVNIESAQLRIEDFHVAIDNYLGDPEKWNLFHRIDYRSGFYLFGDEISTSAFAVDQEFYGDFLVDTRGIRNFQSNNAVTNRVLVGRGESHPVFVTAGVTHKYQKFGFDDRDRFISQMSVDGNVGLNISNIFVKGSASIGVVNMAGSVWLDAKAGYRSDKLFTLSGGFKLVRNEAFVQDQLLVLNNEVIYDQPLNKKTTTGIYGDLEIPFTKTKASVESLLFDNAIYYDTLGLPLQIDEAITGLKLTVQQKLGWRWLQSDHIVHYQVFNNNIWNLPTLLSRHKLYAEFPLFQKQLKLKIGATFSQYLQDEALAFNPITGNFFPVNESLPWYKNLDLFIAGQVQDFRVFVTYENSLDLLEPGVNYQVLNHPQWDAMVRFGVRWILLD